MPWQHFTGLTSAWKTQPTFVIGQLLFVALAMLALWHAKRSGRVQQLTWIAALVAGTANDLIFMALPVVDNFWHAQGIIMLTPRLPLYIPCVYVCFMYYPTIAVRRLRLEPLAQATATGIAAILFYALYDITGAKFLWWSWHDTDLTIAKRLLGAPASSTLWVLTFTASFCWLIDRVQRRDPQLSLRTCGIGLATVAAFTTPLMILQITVLQQLDGGAPGYIALAVGVAIYAIAAARGWRNRDQKAATPQPTGSTTSAATDALLRPAMFAYAAVFVAMMALFDPATHRSTGVHQQVGRCYVEARDITGLVRHEFLCATDFDEDFSFACTRQPSLGSRWYTICGRPHHQPKSWLLAIVLLGIVDSMLFGWLLDPRAQQPPLAD